MTIITTYKCDKCGKEWNANDSSEQICALRLQVTFGYPTISGHEYGKLTHWCRSCVISTGLKPPATAKDKDIAPNPAPDFSEALAELIESLGFIRE